MAGRTQRARSTAHWKDTERRAAELMMGERIVRGDDFAQVDCDGQSEHWIWDCKSWAAHSALKLFWACKAKYATHAGERGFFVLLHERGKPKHRDVVVVDVETWVAVCRAAGLL